MTHLFDDVERRGWFAMVTEWQVGPQPRAMAVVACGDDGAQRCYEAEAETEADALTKAIRAAELGEAQYDRLE